MFRLLASGRESPPPPRGNRGNAGENLRLPNLYVPHVRGPRGGGAGAATEEGEGGACRRCRYRAWVAADRQARARARLDGG